MTSSVSAAGGGVLNRVFPPEFPAERRLKLYRATAV